VQLSLDQLSFICPNCKQVIEYEEELTGIFCTMCQRTYPRLPSGGLAFIQVDDGAVTDDVDKLKSIAKRYSKFYNLLIDIISPVYPQVTFERRRLLKSLAGEGQVILNLGSGSSDFGPEVLNFDIMPYSSVNVTCSIDNIPIADDSVDAIINLAVLEHVPNPDDVIAEFLRVLKPGGTLFCFVPFIQGFHASPWDFQRFTKKGIEVRFKDFQVEWIHTIGPTSGMLWVIQEWLALVFSFGSKKLHTIIWLFLMLITWPIKFLDAILTFHPRAENIASGFSIKARKSL